MFDLHKKINSFYDEKVRLKSERERLRELRNTNIERLKLGTKKFNENKSAIDKIPTLVDNIDQGSMAMFTINQAQHSDDHDLDHALIYDVDSNSVSPEKLKESIAKAINLSDTNFLHPPEARNNAVTIWYADGYHIDFAVYCRKRIFYSDEYEYYHASNSWNKRDPRAITDWFNSEVNRLSPYDKYIDKNQLRRLVRLFKYWAKSRADWDLPGGLVLTTLFVECYKSNVQRDDVAFYVTLRSLLYRLKSNAEVMNPKDHTLPLLTKKEHHQQISSLILNLGNSIQILEALLEDDCTEKTGTSAWGNFFDNTWWSSTLVKAAPQPVSYLQGDTGVIDLNIFLSRNRLISSRTKYTGQGIKKNTKINFEANVYLPEPFSISWEVQNTGQHAKQFNQTTPRPGSILDGDKLKCHETAKFRGKHYMICTVQANNRTYQVKATIKII
jgi:hypothetical protein